ncbi:MAG: flavin prenyltransferase UbiX [Endozoicomonas sp.]
MSPEPVTLAITGASGAQYGLRLLQCLTAAGVEVFFLMSRAARVVIATETRVQVPDDLEEMTSFLSSYTRSEPGQIRVFDLEDWMSPVASGSGAPSSMVVCPCSTSTLSAIACGASNNLIQRAADVALKERRKLILVPRETPLSEIHLEHMLKLTRMGAVVLPAAPGFYNKPESIDELVDFVVARIMNQLGIEHNLMPSWGENQL